MRFEFSKKEKFKKSTKKLKKAQKNIFQKISDFYQNLEKQVKFASKIFK